MVRVGDFWIDRYEYPNVEGEMPRVDVTWLEASNLCAARGQRLCTEQEWELACRGPGHFVYGYGPDFEPERCNTPFRDADGNWVRDRGTAPSGAHADCGNDYGVRDMIGNVWEWTDGWYDPEHEWRVVREGGPGSTTSTSPGPTRATASTWPRATASTSSASAAAGRRRRERR